MRSTIALCIPAYNAAGHLPRLFESVRRQTVPFDEVWVYDDASTDETAAVAERLGARIVRGAVNKGCSAGKNVLLGEVGTAWVHFHDADDTLAPEFVVRARRRIESGEFDVLMFDYEQVDDSTGAQMSRSEFAASDLLRDPVRYMLANTVNNGGVYSVALLRQTGGFDLDPEVRYNEDRAFHLRLAEAGACFCERWTDGSAEHGRVVMSRNAQLLRIRGALGPMQEMGVTGILTITLELLEIIMLAYEKSEPWQRRPGRGRYPSPRTPRVGPPSASGLDTV